MVLKRLKSLFRPEPVIIDLSTFRLQYTLTIAILLFFSLIVSFIQYLGNPIDCLISFGIPERLMNAYCWMHSTYIHKDAFFVENRFDFPQPGIGNDLEPKDLRYINYYQWVCYCLLFQAILFFAPHWLWKKWEGGKIASLKMNLEPGLYDESDETKKKNMLVEYLHTNLLNHKLYAYRYFFCELLGFINLIVQMAIMNKFCGGTFLTLGFEAMSNAQLDDEFRNDTMTYTFPKVTKCTFKKFGVSGTVEQFDAMCILPLNVVNEKIYIFLWFWMFILFICTFMAMIFRLCIIFSSHIRAFLIYNRFRFVSKDCVEFIIEKTNTGDWFLLYMLGQNIDAIIYKDVMIQLSEKLGYIDKSIGES